MIKTKNIEKHSDDIHDNVNTIPYDVIPERIEFIKKLLDGNTLKSMIDFDTCDTEYVEKKSSNDICNVMGKQFIMKFDKQIHELGGKIQYIKSGSSGHTFKGTTYDKDGKTELYNYAIKVVAYPLETYGNINDIKRPENAELMMLRVLANLVVNSQTPHVVLPIGTFNTNIKDFIKASKQKCIEEKKYKQFINRYHQMEFHDKVSVLISEWANGGDLLEYLKSNYKTMKFIDWVVIFFQIICVLSVIQNKYPAFRHNDLKANNILVQKIDVLKDENNNISKYNYFKYEVNLDGQNYIYKVLNTGIQIKLWDFDFACIPGIVDNEKVNADWTKKINVKPEQNRYYDIHYFFNTLTKKGFFPEFWNASEIHPRIKQFIKDIIPDKYSKTDKNIVSDRGRLLVNVEYTNPKDILIHHKLFNCLRSHKQRVTEQFIPENIKQLETVSDRGHQTNSTQKPMIIKLHSNKQ